MHTFDRENLSHDVIHGYIPFTSSRDLTAGEASEQTVIDHPWVQRLRRIHQLQTAWWVFPTAEHTRFQHVIGAMHLASRAAAALYDSLRETCPEVPSRGYIESLLRMAGLLHDVGHGPFGHFFDEFYLREYGLTHELIGGLIIRDILGETLRRIRRNPHGELQDGECLDPAQVAWLITRPRSGPKDEQPRWLRFLRALLSGIYTIDNMDFVLRDAYMSGYSVRAFDLERLLHYSFFSHEGLTIHDRGVDALVRFMEVRGELFRSIYFHRTVRAIDITMADLFAQSKEFLFPGNPAEHLEEYLQFTEWSLLIDVASWVRSDVPRKRALGERWASLLRREVPWKMACQRNLVFDETDRERSSIFSDPGLVERKLREGLPHALQSLPLRIDIAKHIHRPHTKGPASGQNFLFDSAHGRVRPLAANELFSHIPVSHRICRVYAESRAHAADLAAAFDHLLGGTGDDDLTNL